MDDYGTNSFEGKIYIIFLHRGLVKDDKTLVFNMPVVVAFIRYEGKKGLNFQGLKNSVIQTVFEITTENLNKDNTPKLRKEDMIESTQVKITNAKQDPSMIVNLEPMTFSEVVSCILKSNIMDDKKEAKKMMFNRWERYSLASHMKDETDESDSGSDDEQSKGDMISQDIFGSQQ